MNVRALQYFIETVRQRSFTVAAQHMGVTQSTVSKMVRQLEDDFGDTLIIREAKQFLLSDSGQIVWERGQEVLAAIQRLETDVRQTQALQQGRLALGIPPMINLLFTDVLTTFTKRYPDIQLNIKELPGPAIEQQVASQDLELGFSILPVASDLALQSQAVVSHQVWVLGNTSFFSSKSKTLQIQDLENIPQIWMGNEFGLTRLLRQAFAKEGLRPHIVAQSSQWDWVASLANSGLGVAILPEPFLARFPHTHLKALPLAPEQLRWEVASVWNGHYLSLAARAWLQCCEEILGGQWVPDNLQDSE
ncbi:LysR family transcriptional regulator [Alcaligenaceae bacterium 429]|uniref:LysR family transcriptional regulator n=1 Tax=Paenalcaligenes sp. Me52 TaxID=3392038 RepID=UPI00109307A8|nr:LysR family transcriptional regulator [Alcaligenaceae bacterium 429]